MRVAPLLSRCVGVTALALSLSLPAVAPADDNGPVTPAGWRVTPVGSVIGVDHQDPGFQGPFGTDLSPDGHYALSASSGASKTDSADLFDLEAGHRSSYVPYDATKGESAFYGVAWAPDGKRAWVAGGGQNVVHVVAASGGQLTQQADISDASLHFPAGIAYGHTPKGDRVYVVNNLSGPAGSVNPPGGTVTVIDPNAGPNGTVVGTIDLGSRLQPLGVTFDRTGTRAFVTNWQGRSVAVIDTATEQPVGDVALSAPDQPQQADHPSAIAANPKIDEVYTANANSDTVSVIDAKAGTLLSTIDVSLTHSKLNGGNPEGITVTPDGRHVLVALSGENALAVIDVASRRTIGFVPTDWYPSDVDVTPDGKRIVVTNTNDSGAGPNPCGQLQPPTPPAECTGPNAPTADSQYAGSMIKGSIQVIDVDDLSDLRGLTNRVMHNNHVAGAQQQRPKALSAIKHVIYVIKENRTYDQVFGDLPHGNGDPRLVLFDDKSAPNHRELARRFGLLDNFYADAEVSADGHNWATQANATDYVDKTWPVNYSPFPRGRQRAYDFEDVPLAAQFATEPLASDTSVPRPAAAQTVGYIWDNAYDHNVSYRDYGEYTAFPADCSGGEGNVSNTTHLQDRFGNHVDHRYAGYSTACSDHTVREPEWEREFRQFDAQPGDTLPALEIVRLPNDHTAGTRAGAATPQAYMADNDLALGRIVQAVSHSRFWKSTLILVTEDDAQNGPDHVDAHRTIALEISPWTQRRGQVDSTHYSTSSMIATAETALGLPPMSIVDERSSRLFGLMNNEADTTPYDAITPAVTPFGDPGAPVNGAAAPLAAQAARWNLAKEDAAPEIALNTAIWKSVKGRHSKMPAPRHVHIIGSTPNDEND